MRRPTTPLGLQLWPAEFGWDQKRRSSGLLFVAQQGAIVRSQGVDLNVMGRGSNTLQFFIRHSAARFTGEQQFPEPTSVAIYDDSKRMGADVELVCHTTSLRQHHCNFNHN
jgi:hypothetical protein